MIPVALRLQNFLSYATDAPELDFSSFKVACLSGRNGQGKSALLDAITWALWGEARKSGDSRKPDADLLHIGAQRMEVELDFDVDSMRYRVRRWYMLSASGKSNRSGLEFQVYDESAGDYKPITGPSMRQTQVDITRILGLDYDTFINSAFLLQGRSDEFTKRNPNERKEILGRILDLKRFKRLADLAREKQRAARGARETIEAHIERLERDVGEVDAWEEELEGVEEALAEQQQARETQQADLQKLTEQLARMDAIRSEADQLKQRMEQVANERTEAEKDASRLLEQIEAATSLISEADRIQRDYERYDAVNKERNELDHKREVLRGLEKQRDKIEFDRKAQRMQEERQLDKQRLELQSVEQEIKSLSSQLLEQSDVGIRHQQAKAARSTLQALQDQRSQHEAAERAHQEASVAIEQARRELESRRGLLLQQIQQETVSLKPLDHFDQKVASLRARIRALEDVKQHREKVREDGLQLRQRIGEHEGQVQALRAEQAELEERRAVLESTREETCPTCGSALTPTHREQVVASFNEQIQAKTESIRSTTALIAKAQAERNQLLETYQQLDQQVKEQEGLPQELGTLVNKQETAQKRWEDVAQKRVQIQELDAVLESNGYAQAHRDRLQAAQQRMAKLNFDLEAYQNTQRKADQLPQLEQDMLRLENIRGRKEQLETKVEPMRQALHQARQHLDRGEALKSYDEKIARLKQQMEQVGFDPALYERVRREHQELSKAGEWLQQLVNAQQNKSAWEAMHARQVSRAASLGGEHDKLHARRAACLEQVQDQPKVEQERTVRAQALQNQETLIANLQSKRGQLSERLEKAAADMKEIQQLRKDRKAHRSQEVMYGHLRKAFGRTGIPSLIIEQTLPEIEDRANELLGRLTDGRMHVHLETQRDLKSGGTKETLDIKITDEQGVSRPYETFSGGEAFRVNFSLRIALAQLLAERSGVQIRTLVIDEGFGTQDAEGVENMVEAIQQIQTDFDKIMVITHLNQLKEAFPVRIEVRKDPVSGSTFNVLGV